MSASGAVHVYKVGGPALEDPDLVAPLAKEVAGLDGRAVLVHGGGRHIQRMLEALGIESRFVDGRRFTSDEAMEAVEMVLSGVVNKALAAGLTAAGTPAVGLSGRDGGMVRARLEEGLGRVGTPEAVDPAPIVALWNAGLLPVVSPVASDASGRPVNVNADEAALGLARALGATTLVYLSDVDGVRLDGETATTLAPDDAARRIDGRNHRRRDGPQGARRPGGLRRRHPRGGDRRQGPAPRHIPRHAPPHRDRGRPKRGEPMSDALLPVYDRDLVMVKGKGARLWDSAGHEWLDFAAGIAVNGLGYGDRKVVSAIKKQAELLIHASNLYHTEPGSALATRLASLAFPSKVFFCNSGTEAWEGALKFARRIGHEAGRTEYVCFEHSFHGRTMGSLSTTWTAKYREPFEPLVPGVRFCPLNDLAAAAEAVSEKTAAVMVEPVQGEGGIRPASPEFLRGLEALCRERGALLVFDEIQCGLGRTGKMFACEHSGVTPDILTLAKPLAGGAAHGGDPPPRGPGPGDQGGRSREHLRGQPGGGGGGAGGPRPPDRPRLPRRRGREGAVPDPRPAPAREEAQGDGGRTFGGWGSCSGWSSEGPRRRWSRGSATGASWR